MRSSCPLLQQLIVWLIKDEYRQVAAARGAMLADAEEKQWLAALKDVAYDAEDVIDEWNTQVLWHKANSTGGMMDKVRRFVSAHSVS
ncbi:hypothetical protein BHE74_00016869 [Ensete ventricosum]|nr:hypothetical protein BHE74_00016869 [Ensete ventricosum]